MTHWLVLAAWIPAQGAPHRQSVWCVMNLRVGVPVRVCRHGPPGLSLRIRLGVSACGGVCRRRQPCRCEAGPGRLRRCCAPPPRQGLHCPARQGPVGTWCPLAPLQGQQGRNTLAALFPDRSGRCCRLHALLLLGPWGQAHPAGRAAETCQAGEHAWRM